MNFKQVAHSRRPRVVYATLYRQNESTKFTPETQFLIAYRYHHLELKKENKSGLSHPGAH